MSALAAVAGPACATCGTAIPRGPRRPRQYCSRTCWRRAYQPRQNVVSLAHYHRRRHATGWPALARAVYAQARYDARHSLVHRADALRFLADVEAQGLWWQLLRAATVLGCD